MGDVAFKSRDLRNDRGYRAVVAFVWAGLNLNPQPLKLRVRYPDSGVRLGRGRTERCRVWRT